MDVAVKATVFLLYMLIRQGNGEGFSTEKFN